MKQRDYLVGLAIALVASIYYYTQACPTFYFWDSAELTAAIAGNGIPHPPGFPLYLLLGKLFSFLMPSDIGRAISLFSAICAAGAVGLFYLSLIKIVMYFDLEGDIKTLISLACSIALILSYSLTAQATRAEVYALGLLLFMLALYFSVDLLVEGLAENRKSRSFILSLFFIGLGLANHHLTMFLVMPAICYLGWRAKIRLGVTTIGLVALILPISLYFYLMVLARQSPDMNWGNPSNLKALWGVITATGFNKPASAFSLSHISENYISAVSLLYRQVGPVLLALAIAGIVWGWSKQKKTIIYLTLILLFNLCSTILNESYYYENLDFHGYLLFSLVVFLCFAAIGLSFLSKKFMIKQRNYVVCIIAIVAIAIPGYTNFYSASLAGNNSAKRFASTMADGCPDSALVITSSYNTYFVMKAIQHVYHYRTDLIIVQNYMLGQKWYRDYLMKRLNLQQSASGALSAEQFYRYMINNYKNNSEIYIEYDDFSAPLRLFLWPNGYWMHFRPERYDYDRNDGRDSIKADLARIENYLQSGTDYEQLKSMLWVLNNRAGFYRAINEDEATKNYLDEIDRVTENYFRTK